MQLPSLCESPWPPAMRGRAAWPAPVTGRSFTCGSAARVGLDDLVERQLAVLDLVQTVIGERGVAVLVDVVRAEHRLTALGRVHLVDDGLALVALVAGLLYGVQDELHRLVPVDGVRLGVRIV